MAKRMTKKQQQIAAIQAEFGLPTLVSKKIAAEYPIVTMKPDEREAYLNTVEKLEQVRGKETRENLIGRVIIGFLTTLRSIHGDCPKSADLIDGFKAVGDADPKNSAEWCRLFDQASMKWLIPDTVLSQFGCQAMRRLRSVCSRVFHKNVHQKYPAIYHRFNDELHFSSATHFAETLIGLDAKKQKELVKAVIGETELVQMSYREAILALPSFETEYKRIENKQGCRVEPDSGEYHHLIKMAVQFQDWSDRLTALIDEADAIPSGTEKARAVDTTILEERLIPVGSM